MHIHSLSRAEIVAFQRTVRKKVHGELFSVAVAHGAATPSLRYACVVSKKIARKAVERNRIKRLCRAALQKESKTIAKPLTVLLYAKGGAVHASSQEVSQEIQSLLRKFST
ncbi:ribonuclease P protein component [Candidatus Parcubacteria bacterium]|nr:MAG: ribonuclease P protein component [Candidatus Parcubacteria bacterium]